MLGVLEYVADLEALFTHLRHAKCDLVVSYCVSDLTGDIDRAVARLDQPSQPDGSGGAVRPFGFRVERSDRIDEIQFLMRLTPTIAR